MLLSHNRFSAGAKKPFLAGRRLILVDIENLVGGAVLSRADAALAHRLVDGSIRLRHDEQVIVATSHIGLLNTHAEWRGARLLCRSGENGADLKLLQVLNGEGIEERFDSVVLVSGDGIFVDSVVRLSSMGVKVTIVAPLESCSKRLRMAAAQTILLPETGNYLGGVA